MLKPGAELTGEGWSVKCEIDPITDANKWSLTARNLFLYMGSATTVQSVCIMGHDFPGRRGAIRVDKNAPFATSEGGCVSSPMLLRSEEHTSELQSLMRISYAVFCLKKKTTHHIKRKHKTNSIKSVEYI